MTTRGTLVMVGGVVVGLGVLVLAGTSPAGQSMRREGERLLDTIEDWVETLLRKTSQHEGTYGSVNKNVDGQGVSYGIIQWTQLSGNLGKLLTAMYAASPTDFQRVFGPAWAQLLDVTRRGSMDPVDGAVLWSPSWVKRFADAGQVPVFRHVQVQMASRGDHMVAAVKIAKMLDVATERGMVLCYNRTVHQGGGGATSCAKDLLALWEKNPAARPASVNDRLAQFAWQCASRFRRTTAPASARYNDTIAWQAVTREQSELKTGNYSTGIVSVSGVWHAVGGMGSLYDLIVRRSSDILLDRSLRDNPVNLSSYV